MGESDPYLIEVKTSKKLDSRGKKQKRSLDRLHAFYETDTSEGLRGFPDLRRQTHEISERTYVDEINECITEALKDGYAVRQPECGLHYIVMTQDRPALERVMGSLDLKAPLVFFLNTIKSDRTWAPYLPFILTIEGKDHLWDFIRGKLITLVLVESGALCQIAIDKGYKAKFDRDDENHPLSIEFPGGDGKVSISWHILERIGREFVSPEWIVLSSIGRIEMMKRDFHAQTGVTAAN
jgi:hypothetical protein